MSWTPAGTTPPDHFLPQSACGPDGDSPDRTSPSSVSGPTPVWEGGSEALAVRFVGLSTGCSRRQILHLLAPPEVGLAHLKQTHSARVVEATNGSCEEADGLVTADSRLALSVITADCVPVLIGDRYRIGAVHAGWRGIADKIVITAARRLEDMRTDGPSQLKAWVGPAIGPCCYEVSPEVAASVAAASDEEVLIPWRNARPHLDLQLAVRRQLKACGIEEVDIVRACTRCHPEWLHSYRRDGERAGRNHAFIWRRK